VWLFFTSRLRGWVLFSLLMPLGARAAGALAGSLERRGGRSPLTRALFAVSRAAGGRSRGRRSAVRRWK
jgi:hypothetical protein